MKYRINIKPKRNIVFHSQDLPDLNSKENDLENLIFQKMDLILNQQKFERMTKSPKYVRPRKIPDIKYSNLNLKKHIIINKRITLGKFLIENNSKKDIINIINKDRNKQNESINQTIKSKENTLSFFKKKEIEVQKNMNKLKQEINSNNNFKFIINESDHIKVQKRLGKRYTLFKTILNYLESNNITLYELLTNNPFQHKPYQISKSYDFLVGVKFKNYNYVTEALQDSRKFLFSFDYFGQTAYHWAAKLGDLKMLKLLLDFGLHHNQKDFKGRTPLYLAALNNHKEICNYLINNNGNIFLRDKKGLSPVDVAGSKELKYYLYEFMAQPFSNPIYKARIQSFLKDREERIKKKREKELKERFEKHRMEKLLEEEKEKIKK